MISISILSIVFIVSLYLNKTDRAAGLSFSGMCVAHELFLIDLPGSWYCITDAAICCFLATAFYFLKYSEYVEKIMVICVMAVTLNLIGIVFWFAYLPAAMINGCFLVLYAVAAVVTIKRVRNGGANRFNNGHSLSCIFLNQSDNCNCAL